VLDFRDEYLGLASGVRRPWARLCEKRLVEKADLISVATEELGKRLMERYHLPEERIHLTLNGYWQEVKEDLTCPDRDIVRIVYVGAISAAQRLELLCQAVEILVRKKPQLAGNIEVCIYGPDNLYMRKNLLPLAKGRIQYGGFLGMSQVSSVLLDADVCFLSLASPDYAYAIPGKLYEYIAHARPILGALPEGSARRLIEKEGFGLVANCGDARELAQLLERMLNREVRSGFHQRLVEERHHYAARPHFLSLARKVQELR